MSQQVIVGEVVAPYGVRGWVKVHSHTSPPDNILKYSPWLISDGSGTSPYKVLSGRLHGSVIVACLEGVADRDQAACLRHSIISVSREQFSPLEPGEYYWADLIGLEVRTVDGIILGKVSDMMETGANDVMEVQGTQQRLIPFVTGQIVRDVRLSEGVIVVDWDPDF
jgi:16S rRNA processing protein RimM